MTEDNNKQRPVRKLTVKNFSVIKDAETTPLEFGKFTVLIGPQASGKSLLCKLAYFFQKVVIEQAEKSIRESRNLDTFRLRVADEFIHNWFPAFGPEPSSEVRYEDGKYWVHLAFSATAGFLDEGSTRTGLYFSPEIEACYRRILTRIEEDRNDHGEADFKSYAQQMKDQLEGLQSQGGDVYSYIPSTRNFFVSPQMAVLGSSGRNDPITVRFSQDFALDFASRVPQAGLGHKLTHWIDTESRHILRGEVVVKRNAEVFRAIDGRELPLSFLSSGTQELLPLATCLREFVALSAAVASTLGLREALHRRLFYLEEPETNVFPPTQYQLVRIIARMAKESILDASWVITTHSPYILSSFNNLIEAGQAARNNPKLRDEVAKIIPEQYWIKEGDFKAYAIEDGKLKSVLNESGFIDANYLDQVSEVIGDEFDKLLRLEYEHTEAS